jgi:TrmH family RNA methyltransferase
MEKITSLQNLKIKNLIKLQKASERKLQNRILVEGYRETKHAIRNGFEVEQIYFCTEVAEKSQIDDILTSNFNQVFEINRECFDKIAYRETFDGIVSIVVPKHFELNDLKLSKNPLILVLEDVEKPGNIGAILRTSEAANIDALILCNQKTDIFNPNVIRSSLGCVFSVPTVVTTNDDFIIWARKHKIKTYAAALTATKFYHEYNYNEATAIVLGSEAYGLSEQMLNLCDEQIKIPMLGIHDSLNVSVSAAILTFEALRQRNFKQ